jgi:GTP-binding protein
MSNIVAIVGRPNVGKSTLFNRLTGERKAIVEETSGVTRDRHYGKSNWNGVDFSVIDTGGYVSGSGDVFEGEIRKQVHLAIEEADAIVFVVDVTTGVTDLDDRVAKILRKVNKKIILVANKVDSSDRQMLSAEFYSLGLGEVYNLSAISGAGTGEILDELTSSFSPEEVLEDTSGVPKFAIVGKPNVGKSSLINALIGKERNIVTDISGTTRDTLNTRYTSYGFDFFLVDTAGIRKKAKIHDDIEFYSTLRSVRAIEESDVCVFMLDAMEGIGHQDLSIFNIIKTNSKGIVVLVNKWDLVEDKETNLIKEMEEKIRGRLAPFKDVPIIFTSATTKQRIFKALESAIEVYKNRVQKIKTSELNDIMLPIFENTPPPSLKGKYIKIKFMTQLPTHAPSFAVFCNLPQYVRDPYKRFVENQIRKHYNFEGVPIKIFFRRKN